MKDLDQRRISERVDLIEGLQEARRIWMGEKAITAFASTYNLDGLLEDLYDLDRAILHEDIPSRNPHIMLGDN